MSSVRERTVAKILRAMGDRHLPSAEIAEISGVGIGTVRRYLRAWKLTGSVKSATRWLGPLAHTTVYWRVEGTE